MKKKPIKYNPKKLTRSERSTTTTKLPNSNFLSTDSYSIQSENHYWKFTYKK